MPFPHPLRLLIPLFGNENSRSKIAQALICLVALAGLTACSSFGAYQAFTYRKTSGNDPKKVLTYNYVDPSAENYFKVVYGAASGDTQKQTRNRILYELMGMVDDYYFRYTSELRRDVAGKGLLVDTTALATSIAATAAGANEIKTILSAASSSVQGFSKSIDANVFLGNTVQAIRLQMDGTRADIATEMITKMKEQGCADYPLEAGLRDVIRYYDAGTLTSGVAALSKDAGVKKKAAEDNQKAAATTKAKFVKDTASDRLTKLISTSEGKAKLRGWMDSHGLQDIAIALFVHGDSYASEREAAVVDLDL